MIHEFREPIEVDTPLGRGLAFFVHATAHDNHWTVALNESRASSPSRRTAPRDGSPMCCWIDRDGMRTT
jgi:hypothetical protein